MVDASTATKLKASYIEAMERDAFDQLPAPIYAKNFIRIYGNFLGLDGKQLASEFGKNITGIIELPPAARLSPVYHVAVALNSILRHPYIALAVIVTVIIVLMYLRGPADSYDDLNHANATGDETVEALDTYTPVCDVDEPLPRLE